MPIKYIKGDLLKLAKHPSIIAHSCNTVGSWGGGFAYQLSLLFPRAEREYIAHCESFSTSELIGSTLLIHTDPEERGNNGKEGHIIACLFTSVGGGGHADSPSKIVENTRASIKDLEEQLEDKLKDGWVINMPKINSGIFRVPWEDTERVLDESGLQYNVYVI